MHKSDVQKCVEAFPVVGCDSMFYQESSITHCDTPLS